MSARSEVGRRGLVPEASLHLTETIAVHLPFETLGTFKTLLKRYFSEEPWTEADALALSDLVAAHVATGSWTHRLDNDLTLQHDATHGRYRIAVDGPGGEATALWDRVFDGPIHPEATPHPRKVKFAFGGDPAPGIWYLTGDESGDDRVQTLLAEQDVTDVMVAGDFVTIGLHRSSRWEDRLDDMLDLVARTFDTGAAAAAPLSRDELVAEGQATELASEKLHLLNPDHEAHRRRLYAALGDTDARVRRIAVAVLAGSADPSVATDAADTGYADPSRLVRRMAIDAAGDAENEIHRATLESALEDADPWTRWRAVRALGDLGLGDSAHAVTALGDDADFQVRFEVARVLRDA